MNTKLYIGSELADFNEFFNVMFSIGDIRNMSFGNSNKTYTLNLPLTKTNKRLLKFISQPDVKSEPIAMARLYLGGLLIISGKLEILSPLEGVSTKVLINCDDWIDDLKDLKMTSLDLSASDHELNHANVENSWTAAYPVYRYPMIDFGALVSGESNTTAKWGPMDFVPMVSIASLVSKILEPYTISSSWLTSAAIKDTFILCRETIASDEFTQNKDLLVSVASDTDNSNTSSIPAGSSGNSLLDDIKVLLTSETTDQGGDWVNDTYTVPETGTYRFAVSLKLINNAPDVPSFTITNEEVTVRIIRKRGANFKTLATVSAGAYTGTELIDDIVYSVTSGFYHCEAGDEIYVEAYIACNVNNTSGSPLDLTIGIKAVDSTFQNIWSSVNKYSGTDKNISLEEMLPDMTRVDFLAAIRDIYNLRFWMDKMHRTIYIEPWDQLLSSTVVDLSPYVDYESINDDLISPNYSKLNLLKWKDDSDAATEEYLKANGSSFGHYDLTLISEFAKNGLDIKEHSFSSIMERFNFAISCYTLKTPCILNTLPVYPFTTYDRKTAFNTRIVNWKGMTAGLTWYYETETKNTYPKIAGLSWSDIYATYWQKFYHYIDKGKLFTLKMKLKPGMLSQFFAVINTATSEGFRPTYQIEIDGIKNYFFLQKITSDGEVAECELILKQ